MTALVITLLSLGLLAHVLHVVFTDDPTRHRRPPRSHPADEFSRDRGAPRDGDDPGWDRAA